MTTCDFQVHGSNSVLLELVFFFTNKSIIYRIISKFEFNS